MKHAGNDEATFGIFEALAPPRCTYDVNSPGHVMARLTCVAGLMVFVAMSGVGLAREADFVPITSLKDVLLPKAQMPEGWTLLEKRLVRDHHDINLLMTVDVAAKAFGIKIGEQKCQPLRIGDESFNVDFFLVKNRKGAKTLFDWLKGWLDPGRPGDIHWTHQCWGNILMVVSTSNKATQKQVIRRYFRHLLEVLGAKADSLLKQGQDERALRCYAFLGPELRDLPHAYLAWAGLFKYQVKDYQQAVSYYERALKAGGETGFAPEKLWLIQEGIGLCVAMLKDYEKAEAAFVKAIDIARKSKNPRLLGSSNYNLACTYAEQGNVEQMYQYLEEALKVDKKYATDAPKDSSFAKYTQDARFKTLIQRYSR